MKRGLFEVRTEEKAVRKAKTSALMALMALWVALGVPTAAQTDAIYVDPAGNVGIGTSSPSTTLHVMRTSATAKIKIEGSGGFTGFIVENTDLGGTAWQFSHGAGGAFAIDDTDAVNGAGGPQEFRVFNNGDVRISGTLTTSGAACNVTPCDGVFHSNFEVPSIEEHAAAMWANSFLPAIGPTRPEMPFNVTEKTTGILNELEKAHIYIEQLNKSLKASEAENAGLRERLARVEKVLGLAGQ